MRTFAYILVTCFLFFLLTDATTVNTLPEFVMNLTFSWQNAYRLFASLMGATAIDALGILIRELVKRLVSHLIP